MWRAASQINHVIPIPWEDFEFSLFVTLEMIPKTPFVIFFFFFYRVCLTREKVFKFVTHPQKGLASVNFVPAWSLVVYHVIFHLQFGTYTYQLVLSYKIIDCLLTVTCYCPHSHTSTRLDSVILQYVPHKKNRQFLNAPTLENIVSYESLFRGHNICEYNLIYGDNYFNFFCINLILLERGC